MAKKVDIKFRWLEVLHLINDVQDQYPSDKVTGHKTIEELQKRFYIKKR